MTHVCYMLKIKIEKKTNTFPSLEKMKGIVCFFLILIAKCATSTSQQCSASFVGRQFVFGAIGFVRSTSGPYLRLHITPTEQVQAHVQITAPFSNLNKTLNVSNFTIRLLSMHLKFSLKKENNIKQLNLFLM